MPLQRARAHRSERLLWAAALAVVFISFGLRSDAADVALPLQEEFAPQLQADALSSEEAALVVPGSREGISMLPTLADAGGAQKVAEPSAASVPKPRGRGFEGMDSKLGLRPRTTRRVGEGMKPIRRQ